MPDARLLRLYDLMNTPPETPMFIETKTTLRPAFFMGVDNADNAVSLITPAKIAKHWQWRLNNRTWRVWSARPTREQRTEEKWDA